MGKIIAGAMAEFPDGSVSRIMIDRRNIAVINMDDTYYAVDDICTHEGARLSDGTIEQCHLVCPRHDARFDYTTGSLVQFRDTIPDLAKYTVIVEDNNIFIEVP